MLTMIEVEIDRDGRVRPLEPLPFPLQGRAYLALLPDPSANLTATGATGGTAADAFESMAKRKVMLDEVKTLIEEGTYQTQAQSHGWIFRHFPVRADNLVCAAVVNDQTIIVKTVMIDWKQRDMP